MMQNERRDLCAELIDRIAEAVVEKLRGEAPHLFEPPAADKAGSEKGSLLDVYQAAELLGCSVSTVDRLVRLKRMPSIKVGHLRRFHRDDLLSYLRGAPESQDNL